MLLISSGPSPPLSGTGEPALLSFSVMSRGTDLAAGMEIAMVLSSRGRGSEKVKQECIIFRNPEAAFAKGGGFRLKTRLARGCVERSLLLRRTRVRFPAFTSSDSQPSRRTNILFWPLRAQHLHSSPTLQTQTSSYTHIKNQQQKLWARLPTSSTLKGPALLPSFLVWGRRQEKDPDESLPFLLENKTPQVTRPSAHRAA